jgi:uncharacterized protein involved in exopolysaccharide biosynthesis
MNEPPLDLRQYTRPLARGLWIIVTCAVLGAAAAVGIIVARPIPTFTARATVLLTAPTTDASGQSARDIKTEVVIARSQPVLDAAGRSLRPTRSVTELKSRVAVAALTSDILQFTGKGRSASEAITNANATADAYRAYTNRSASGQLQQQLAPLKARAAGLSTQINNLQNDISAATAQLNSVPPNSAQAIVQAAKITSLQTDQNTLSNSLKDVNTAITNTEASGAGLGATSLSPATNASNGALRAHVIIMSTGAFLGALIGCVVVFVRDARRRKRGQSLEESHRRAVRRPRPIAS